MKAIKLTNCRESLAQFAALESPPLLGARERPPPGGPRQASIFGRMSGSICSPSASLLNWLYSPTTANSSPMPSRLSPSRCTAARCEMIQ